VQNYGYFHNSVELKFANEIEHLDYLVQKRIERSLLGRAFNEPYQSHIQQFKNDQRWKEDSTPEVRGSIATLGCNFLYRQSSVTISLNAADGKKMGDLYYPGLFLYARGHNLEKCFESFIVPEHRKNFKQIIMQKLMAAKDLTLPEDLINVILEVNRKVRNQANRVMKPHKAPLPAMPELTRKLPA
jgi:hypothetical protein